MTKLKESCDCCGTCCRKGGPALHKEDYSLLQKNIISPGSLITLRKGEYAHQPMSDTPKPLQQELIKIRGRGGDWCCLFFDNEKSVCTIYDQRPIACRLLKCWDPEDILAITEKNLLQRLDLIPEEFPLRELIIKHESECSVTKVNSLVEKLRETKEQKAILDELSGLVNVDLKVREYAAVTYKLSLESEMFYLGRPLFQLLHAFNITVTETPHGISLQYKKA